MRAEVGVGSLHSRRQLLKALYWKKLCTMSSDRLVSLIFRRRHTEVLAGHGALSCLNSFKTCLDELDLGSAWSDATADDWDSLVRAQVLAKELHQQAARQLACTSLTLYTALDHSYAQGAHSYLLDRGNLPGTRLKTHLRLGILWTMSRVASVAKWPASGGCCLVGLLKMPSTLCCCAHPSPATGTSSAAAWLWRCPAWVWPAAPSLTTLMEHPLLKL